MAAKALVSFRKYQSDHDVLIELRTEMRGMRGDIKDRQVYEQAKKNF